MSEIELSGFLGWYTGRPAYQKVIAKGGPRVDLEGREVSLTSERQQKRAAAMLAGRAKYEASKRKLSAPPKGCPVSPIIPGPERQDPVLEDAELAEDGMTPEAWSRDAKA